MTYLHCKVTSYIAIKCVNYTFDSPYTTDRFRAALFVFLCLIPFVTHSLCLKRLLVQTFLAIQK